MCGCESWTIKKAEHWRIDAFELWCWRRFLKVPWTARRSNQSILKEMSPKYSLEGLMLKLKLQYFGHLMWRTDLLEKTLMLGKIESWKRGWDGWMASPTQWTWIWVNSRSWRWTGRPGVLQSTGLQRVRHDWATELNWAEYTESVQGKCIEGSKNRLDEKTPHWQKICLFNLPVVLEWRPWHCTHPWTPRAQASMNPRHCSSKLPGLCGLRHRGLTHPTLSPQFEAQTSHYMTKTLIWSQNELQFSSAPQSCQTLWDRMWSTGEGNGKPLQYSCLEKTMNSMKRQKDRTLKDELPRSVGAQFATGDQ